MRKFDPLGLVLPISILIVWQVASATGVMPSYVFPGPVGLLYTAVDFVFGFGKTSPYSGTMAGHLAASIVRVLAGFGTAVIIGTILGFATGRLQLVRRIVAPTIDMARTMPGIGWLPLAMVWFGIGERTTVFLIALAAFFPIYINTAYGASRVPDLYMRAARMLGAGKAALFTTVILPSAIPSVVVGLRLGLGIAWAYLVLGELTGVSRGMGAVMMDARLLGRVEMVPIAMLGIAAFGKLTDLGLVAICRRLYPHALGGSDGI